MPRTWEDVASVVKRRRLALRLSQRGAAAAAGVSPTTWQSLEKYHQPVNDHTKLGVATALRWHPEAIDRYLAGDLEPDELINGNGGNDAAAEPDGVFDPRIISSLSEESRKTIEHIIRSDPAFRRLRE